MRTYKICPECRKRTLSMTHNGEELFPGLWPPGNYNDYDNDINTRCLNRECGYSYPPRSEADIPKFIREREITE
jgi:hypothetical protein